MVDVCKEELLLSRRIYQYADDTNRYPARLGKVSELLVLPPWGKLGKVQAFLTYHFH